MYDAIKYIHHIINCIVDCYTAIIWGSLNNKHDRTVFKTRFHFFELSIQIEDCSNLMWKFFMHIEKVRCYEHRFWTSAVTCTFPIQHRELLSVPDLPLVIDSLLSLGAAILNIP